MPYADPARQKAANRANKRKQRAREGRGLDSLADAENALPDPPSRDFLLKALGVQAREGNVPAIRLLLEEYRRERDENEAGDPFAGFDELAKRRAG